jgi:hypothetical protein
MENAQRCYEIYTVLLPLRVYSYTVARAVTTLYMYYAWFFLYDSNPHSEPLFLSTVVNLMPVLAAISRVTTTQLAHVTGGAHPTCL